MEIQKLEISAGENISSATTQAIAQADQQSAEVHFDFNDVPMVVRSNSSHQLLLRDFHRAMNHQHFGIVGPYPPAELSPKQLQFDKVVADIHANRAAKQTETYKQKQAEKQSTCEGEIGNTSIALSDSTAWDEFKKINTDGYGGAIVTYAERWAKLMQVRMADGTPLEKIAEQSSSDADVEGITGFMYGCAVGQLAQCWEHGEQLRRWHNLGTQLGSEGEKANEIGGVLNPALLNIG